MKNVKKIIAHGILAIMIASIFSVSITAHAGIGDDIVAGFGKMFAGEDKLSFTEYKGTLSQLSPEGYDSSLVANTDLKSFVLKIVNFALTFLGLLAVLIVIYGGVLYVTSGGEEEKTGKGKKAITYASIGILIVLGSYAFVNTIIKGAGAGETGPDGQIAGADGSVGSPGSFNAAAAEVKAIAEDIYRSYSFLMTALEDLKSMNADAQKSSISVESKDNLPSKGSIMAYLTDIKAKLESIKGKAGQFTVLEKNINTQIRRIDNLIDTLNNSIKAGYVGVVSNGGFYSTYECDPGSESSGEAFERGRTGKNKCEQKGIPYNDLGSNFYNIWLTSPEINLYSFRSKSDELYGIMKDLIDSFLERLGENLNRLADIQDYMKNLTAVSGPNTDAGKAFNEMMGTGDKNNGQIKQMIDAIAALKGFYAYRAQEDEKKAIEAFNKNVASYKKGYESNLAIVKKNLEDMQKAYNESESGTISTCGAEKGTSPSTTKTKIEDKIKELATAKDKAYSEYQKDTTKEENKTASDEASKKWTDCVDKFGTFNIALNSLNNAQYYVDYFTALFEKANAVQEKTPKESAAAADGKDKINAITGNSYPLLLKTLALNTLETNIVDVDFIASSEHLINGLTEHLNYYNALLKIKFVNARLVANIGEGNAPLEIIFSVKGSVDPAGNTIRPGNITWDIAGAAELNDPVTAFNFIKTASGGTAKNIIVPDNDSVKCFAIENSTGGWQETAVTVSNEDTTPVQRCVFNRPGTYRANVFIKSNNDTLYGPGFSSLNINVTPPATKMKIKILPSGSTNNPIWVMDYFGEELMVNEDEVYVTKAETTKMVIDLKDTQSTKDFKWYVDPGQSETFTTKNTYEFATGLANGIYPIKIAARSPQGVIDEKKFNLVVTDLAARIKSPALSNIFVGDSVTFDGSGSVSSGGAKLIQSYKWDITTVGGDNPGTNPDYMKDSCPSLGEEGPNNKMLVCKFTTPRDNVVVSLTITDKKGTSIPAAKTSSFKIKSKPPVAAFEYAMGDRYSPGKIYLDASKTFDPDTQELVTYMWKIKPVDANNNNSWTPALATSRTKEAKQTAVTFKKKGEYEISLVASDGGPEVVATKTVTIDKVVDINMDISPSAVNMVDSESAPATFTVNSEVGASCELDFADGEIATGQIADGICKSNGEKITHKYKQAGKYAVKAKVTDGSGEENSITKNLFVNDGSSPTAVIQILKNGVEVVDLSSVIQSNKKDVFKFSAINSLNKDGTTKNLNYSWKLADNKLSTEKEITYSYKEPGDYNVQLVVSDKETPKKEASSLSFDPSISTVGIKINRMPPTFSSVQAIPVGTNSGIVTPVTFNVKVYGADDPDGQITQYKWWYFPEDDSEDIRGLQITTTPSAQISIGTGGKEGTHAKYGLGLEIMDNDNQTFSTKDLYGDKPPKVEVINGKNELPVAKFAVDKVKALVGDTVTFTSSSKDPDGQIKKYIWDFEGKGFGSVVSTDQSVVEHKFTARNMKGYAARLKVVDDKGGEATSEPIMIYIDSLAKAPKAAFNVEPLDGTDGKGVKFLNNSLADEEAGAKIISYAWDFDTNVDSDGDSIKDNDNDSDKEKPEHTYPELGKYKVKLTITDDQGNTDDVTNEITLPLSKPPVAAFTYTVGADGSIQFKNNSVVGAGSTAQIKQYVWDFDVESNLPTADSNGDGIKNNDNDSSEKDPIKGFDVSGLYKVQLTVIDTAGGKASVTNPVNVQIAAGGVISSGGIAQGGTQGGTQNGGTVPPVGTPEQNKEFPNGLIPVLATSPTASSDGIIYISDNPYNQVTFDFTGSKGQISYYSFDKNIYFDTNKDGILDNDDDYKTAMPGRWTTNFDKAWGKIVMKLTVTDLKGNKSEIKKEIKFQ